MTEQMTDEPLYSFRRKGRSWSTLIALLIAWLLLLLGWTVFDAAPLLVGILFLLSLPAAWDFYTARLAGADLHADRFDWFSGTRSVSVPLEEIDHIRLVTRLDLTVRAAALRAVRGGPERGRAAQRTAPFHLHLSRCAARSPARCLSAPPACVVSR